MKTLVATVVMSTLVAYSGATVYGNYSDCKSEASTISSRIVATRGYDKSLIQNSNVVGKFFLPNTCKIKFK